MRRWVLLLAATLSLGVFWDRGVPRELGQVHWERDFDASLAQSAGEGRPLFVLFQEVPGCSTCVSFGDQVLSHPLLVEAIETEFVPVFVYNNKGGRDAELLARFGEPAWNNPVVRFLDAEGRDLVERRAGLWAPHAIGARMVAALEASGRPVPAYLREAVGETRPRYTERARFGMYCYWSGEACLGGIPGVVRSQTGHLRGGEVVELEFDPDLVSYEELVAEARRRGCADRVFALSTSQRDTAAPLFGDRVTSDSEPLRVARERDQKYYLRRSPLQDLQLTSRQAVRVNAAVAAGRDPARYLSPRQRELLTAAR